MTFGAELTGEEMPATRRAKNHGEAGYCIKCNTYCDDGPDPCLGIIPGVLQACCGHDIDEAYCVIGDTVENIRQGILHLTGEKAERFFALVKENNGTTSEKRTR